MLKWWKRASRAKPRREKEKDPYRRLLGFEGLEDRRLLTVTLTPLPAQWVPAGPSPILGGPSTTSPTSSKNPAAGGVEAILVDTLADSTGNTVYVGTVNGGIWYTTNFGAAAGPNWVPLTDLNPSLSIASLALDPADLTGKTIVAGIGRFSDAGENSPPLNPIGGNLLGVLRTTNGGQPITTNGVTTSGWTALPAFPTGTTHTYVAVAENDAGANQYVFAADNGGAQYVNSLTVGRTTTGGLYWSTNGGQTQSTPNTPLPSGAASDLIQDPNTPSTFYAAVMGNNAGVFRTTDNGLNWFRIADLNAMPELSGSLNIRLAVSRTSKGSAGTLYTGIEDSTGALTNVYWTSNSNSVTSNNQNNEGVVWTAMGVPTTSNGGIPTINPLGLGALYFSITADPLNASRVYVGGDFQPANGTNGFPNTIGAIGQTGVIFRGDVVGTATAWTPVTDNFTSGKTAPAGGSRVMRITPTGTLLEGDNGGIFTRSTPTGNTGDWSSSNGIPPSTPGAPLTALQISELTNVAYNPVGNTIIATALGLGVIEQSQANTGQFNTIPVVIGTRTAVPTFVTTAGAVGVNGGSIAVDTVSQLGSAIVYGSLDYFQGFFKQTLTGSNTANPPAPTYPAVLVNGSPGQNIYQVEANLAGGPSFAFSTPIATNNVTPNMFVVGSAYVYESVDGGSTVTAIQGLTNVGSTAVPINGVGPVTAMAYGGKLNGVNNQYVLWVGSAGSQKLYLRTAQTFVTGAGTYQNPVNVLRPLAGYPGGTPNTVVMDPNNWTTAYVADGVSVTIVTNANATPAYNSIVGPAGLTILSMAYVPSLTQGGTASVVVAGFNAGNPATTGVYQMFLNQPGVWTMIGAGIPHVPVYSVNYDQTNDMLTVGTLGRGAWQIKAFASGLNSYSLTITGTAANDILVMQADPVVAGGLDVILNGQPFGPFTLSSIKTTSIDLLAGANSFTLNFANGNPVNAGTFTFVNTGGTSSLTVTDNANMSLSNSVLTISNAGASITLSGVTTATLTGGAGNNTFDLSGFTGTATIAGVSGTDTFTFRNTNNGNLAYVLTPTQLLINAVAQFNFTNISAENVAGGTGNDTFDVTAWTGTGSVDGGGGADTLNDTNITSNVTFGDAVFQVVGGPNMTIARIQTMNLTGGAGNNLFNDTGFSGIAYVNGGGGSNTIAVTKDANFWLYNTAVVAGTGFVFVTNIQNFNVTGGASNNFFDFSTFTFTATVNGGGGTDTIYATAPVNFTITTAQILKSDGGTVNLTGASVSMLSLFSTAANSNYFVNSWKGGAFLIPINGHATFRVGGAAGAGNLDNINGFISYQGSLGSSIIFNDDAYGVGVANMWYNIAGGIFNPDIQTPRLFNSQYFDSAITSLTINGAKANSVKYLSTPSFYTTYNFNGNSTNDFLGTFFFGTPVQILNGANTNLPPPYTGNWTFTDATHTVGQKPINFTNMDGINGVGILVVSGGADAGNNSSPLVQVFDQSSGNFKFQFFAYDSSFTGGVHVATGNFNPAAPTHPYIVTVPGRGMAPLIKVWDGNNGQLVDQFYANYPSGFTSGLEVAVGDITGDNIPDIVVAPNRGAVPVLVYDGAKIFPNQTPRVVDSIVPYGNAFQGGISVAVAKLNPTDANASLATVPLAGMAALVKVYSGASVAAGGQTLVNQFYAFPTTFIGGASIAVGDVNADGIADFSIAQGAGGTAQVVTYNGAQVITGGSSVGLLSSFVAFADNSPAAIRITMKDVDGDGRFEIFAVQGPNGTQGNVINIYRVMSHQLLASIKITNGALQGGLSIG